jgi:diguanylate cyclase (GGDEF)-like protein
MDRLGCALRRAKRRKDSLFAVLFVDLDRFKVINDSLGHMIGDQLLIAIAQRLRICLRSEDTAARLGGDEFAILLENITDISDAIGVANRIQEELTLPFNLGGQEVFTSTSVGIALGTEDYDKPEDLLRDADTAMYHAKALGKARYEVFNTTMHDHAVTLLQLETSLRQAIGRQEFRLYYQPIVLLETGKITGFEALVRWQHPLRGLISPGEFISVAEETGAIIPIGYWVLHEACRQMRAWQLQFPEKPLSISVNLSSKQFSHPKLIESISQILQKTGLDARSLKLEITESAIMENSESATAMLLQLRDMEVELHLDDFGTGYSSLSYLHRFPVDVLKIDRSFTTMMNISDEKAEIVRTILMLANNLGMEATAEGIETAEQLAQLKGLQCKYGQGYFFSKPLDREAAGAMMAQDLL